ncbi:MAG TPA: UvrD-helicase domain-containing protein [Planktothrix sp.]|jgi:DNA helicase-2/ATP-dependent DNA helicase PcrA
MTANTAANRDLLDRLNAEQAQAVSLNWGPALIIAGAGSGKTTVLTRRIAWLISQLEQDAEQVLAVTFTNKAAGEMKHRVEALVGHDVGRRLSIGTFHSICARILRREIDEYVTPEGFRWTNNFVIYDETDSLNIVKNVIAKMNLDVKAFVPKTIKHQISSFKNDCVTHTEFATVARQNKDTKISEIFTAYQESLARNNALDFDDLIMVFNQLLKQNKNVLGRLRRRYRHILVDEFQDTNKAQYELISLLAGPEEGEGWHERSLMVVGDVDQSIYSWRKADFRIILGFQNDYKECQLIKLEENYRSTSTILDIANSIIENNTERLEKVLRCNRGKGGKAQCFEAPDDIEEAYYVIEELKRIQARGRKLAECCILYRTNSQSRRVEEFLVRNHMPYIVVGATKFYDRAEIKDILAYLRLIYNECDSISFNRVINVPRRGIGKTSIERLEAYAEENGLSLVQAAEQAERVKDLPSKALSALKEFSFLMRSWQNSALLQAKPEIETPFDASSTSPKISVAELLLRVLKETRYLERLAEDSDKDELAEGRIENVKELVVVAQEFDETADEPDLDSFLTRVSLVSDLDNLKAGDDAVKMMTVHSAKGLEFPIVFVMGLEDGLFPHIRSLDSPTAMEEERRLMYVAVTRAADLLYLTLARKRMLIGRADSFSTSYTLQSRFLKEIAPGLVAGYYPRSVDAPASADEEEFREHDSFVDGGSDSGRHTKYGGGTYDSSGSNSKYGGGGGGYNGSRGGGGSYGNSSGNGAGSNSNSGTARSSYYGRSGFGTNNDSFPNRSANNAQPSRPRAMRPGDAAANGNFVTNTPRKPDNIRVQIDARPPSAAVVSFEHLAVGDTVQHPKFGTGRVVSVIGEQDKELYNIEFDEAGKRLMDPRFAKLIKVV